MSGKEKLNLEFNDLETKTYFYQKGSNNTDFLGSIYFISNDFNYAIIFKKQIPAISGPPLDKEMLLEAGKINDLPNGISKKVYDLSIIEAKKIANKKNLELITKPEDIFSKYKGSSIFPQWFKK
jgi:hypothetical protein